MIDANADIVIIGAGFGGSVTALIADRIGLKPVLIERHRHPRFAIGESSTPLADLVLESLVERYDLPRLAPLARYGSWKKAYPDLPCGLKRGFSFFQHRAGERFAPCADHANELLVAANADAMHGDTHWLRSSFDHFLVEEVRRAGIEYLDQTELTSVEHDTRWTVQGRCEGGPVRIQADFVVDASGAGGVLAKYLGLDCMAVDLRTNSRSIYGHFRNVALWTDVFHDLGGDSDDHPFCADDAAVHHVFEGGWMWQLRFDNGVVSAGFAVDAQRFPLDSSVEPQREWDQWLSRFPSLAQQFSESEVIEPIRRTGRLQRCASRIAGANWAMLPSAAGFVDPLYSAGNAHTLSGVERIMDILATSKGADQRARRLMAYDQAVRREFDMLDQMIHGGFLTFDRFELFGVYSMLYFAAAHFSEHQRRSGTYEMSDGFLNAGDEKFFGIVRRGYDSLSRIIKTGSGADAFATDLARAITPYNLVGLCDPAKRNMYDYQ